MICCSFKAWKEKRQYKKWLTDYQIPQHINAINQLFEHKSGHVISTQARLHQPNLSLTYGEIDLESFLALLSLTNPGAEDKFYDLGCGLGKTVFACHKVYDFKKCYGIECLPELVDIAQCIQQQLSIAADRIQFICDDILNVDWQSNSIIYLNIASFIPEIWQQISFKIQQNPAKKIITLAKPIANLSHHQVKQTQVLTSWGIVPAYVYLKTDI